ncbi:MAG: ethanolamine ammonia-lyase subunit EutC [Actinobacteria bacterium]|nr:ethanolamine ammonia-lyase subunit EutC [Actinomycetota bacterium]
MSDADLDPKRSDLAADASLARLRALAAGVTPARVLLEGPGSSYSTRDLLRLRADHAAAREAIRADLDVDDPALARLIQEFGLVGLRSKATSLAEYLASPQLGRELAPGSRARLEGAVGDSVDLQVVIGDGLSPRAPADFAPGLFELLSARAEEEGWRVGPPVFIRRCRVGVMNEIGELTGAAVVVLLIGERPGLGISRSMSAYLGFRPGPGDTDADRNLVCNIHDDGVSNPEACRRIMSLARMLRAAGTSGVRLKESADGAGPAGRLT